MNRSATEQRCAYCGRRSSERDHVPPKNLFRRPLPSDLITVPVCSRCHKPTHRDDEYFRTNIAFREDLADHPDIQGGVAAAALRSLQRTEARGYTRAFFRSMRNVDLRTESGLWVGRRTGYQPDVARLLRTPERAVRGLYFHHIGNILRGGVRLFEDSLVDWTTTDDAGRRTAERLVDAVKQQPLFTVGSAFSYRFLVQKSDDEQVSTWLLTFYDRMTFLGISSTQIQQGALNRAAATLPLGG